jgi:hypothetical protein
MTTTATRDSGVRRIKPAELARELGVSRQAINDLQKRGKLPRSDDGLVDVDLARHAIASRVRPSGKTAGALTAPPPQTGGGMSVDSEQVSYMEAKRQRESAEAKIAHLKLRQMEGELVSIEKVRAASMRMARMLRDAVLGVPSRIAQTIANETDAHQIEQTLMASLRRALDDIANLNVEDIKRIEE